MVWSGSVKCPNCSSPIDADVSACPYCYSTTPMTGPWKVMPTAQAWLTYAPIFLGVVAFGIAAISDALFGTTWIPQLLGLFVSKS